MCPACERATMRRIGRVGFFQRVVMPWFGFYPWECSNCRSLKFLRVRGIKRKRRSKR
jgi:hypothetical protein